MTEQAVNYTPDMDFNAFDHHSWGHKALMCLKPISRLEGGDLHRVILLTVKSSPLSTCTVVIRPPIVWGCSRACGPVIVVLLLWSFDVSWEYSKLSLQQLNRRQAEDLVPSETVPPEQLDHMWGSAAYTCKWKRTCKCILVCRLVLAFCQVSWISAAHVNIQTKCLGFQT